MGYLLEKKVQAFAVSTHASEKSRTAQCVPTSGNSLGGKPGERRSGMGVLWAEIRVIRQGGRSSSNYTPSIVHGFFAVGPEDQRACGPGS